MLVIIFMPCKQLSLVKLLIYRNLNNLKNILHATYHTAALSPLNNIYLRASLWKMKSARRLLCINYAVSHIDGIFN